MRVAAMTENADWQAGLASKFQPGGNSAEPLGTAGCGDGDMLFRSSLAAPISCLGVHSAFRKTRSAPNAIASCPRSAMLALERIITGVAFRAGVERMYLSTSAPFSLGIMRSNSTRLGFNCLLY